MSWGMAFNSAVTTYNAIQVSQINSNMLAIQNKTDRENALQKAEEDKRNKHKEIIFTLNNALKKEADKIKSQPELGYFVSLTTERMLSFESVTSSSFDVIAEKEYYQNVINLLSEIKLSSTESLGFERCQYIEARVNYFLSQQNFRHLLATKEALSVVNENKLLSLTASFRNAIIIAGLLLAVLVFLLTLLPIPFIIWFTRKHYKNVYRAYYGHEPQKIDLFDVKSYNDLVENLHRNKKSNINLLQSRGFEIQHFSASKMIEKIKSEEQMLSSFLGELDSTEISPKMLEAI